MSGLELSARAPAVLGPADTPETRAWLERLFSQGACKGRLLLVDDDPDIRQLLALVLQREGYQVREAGDGAECLRVARVSRPELIILNYIMPVMDGLSALRELKMDPTVSYIKVLMYSAIRDFDWFQKASLEGGAVGCLQTPFAIKPFLCAVESALGSR